MKKILVLHHTDLDGAGSAAVVGLYHQGENITYRMYNYGWPLSPKDLEGYDLIYAVDVSFNQSAPWVYELPELIWIDHHKTALEYENQNPWMHQIPGYRSIGKGACELTWEYLFPNYECPDLIKYLSTYDVWDKTRTDWKTVEEIEIGAKHILGIKPQPIIDFILAERDPRELQEMGRTILGYIEKSGKGKLLGSGFYLRNFYGYRGLALCTNEFSSMSFLSYYNPEIFDIMIAFQVIPVEDKPGEIVVRVSMYTENPNIDVSEIAKLHNGGGHPGAAGFTTDLHGLREILKTGESLKTYVNSIGFKGNEPRHY